MRLRNDVPLPGSIPSDRGLWGKMTEIFRDAKHGQSVHFSDEKKMASFKASFYTFKKNNGVTIKIIKRRVGTDDPDGEGYRIFFIDPPETENIWG